MPRVDRRESCVRSRTPPVTVHAATVTLAAFPSGHATDAAGLFVAAAYVVAITIARRRVTQITCFAISLFLEVIVGLSRLVLARASRTIRRSPKSRGDGLLAVG